MAYNEARKRATMKYQKEYTEQILFRVKKGEKKMLQNEASTQGMSMAQYLIQAVNNQAGRQLLTPSDS